MKVIKATTGEDIFVDDSDYEFLSKYNWYVKTNKSGNKYAVTGHSMMLMHRMILGITDSKVFIDHKDRNGLNNQRSNMRFANHSTNAMNKLANGEVKYKGVCIQRSKQKYFHKGSGEWREANTSDKIRARIKINGKNIDLGSFKTIEDAAIAYNDVAIKYHGEFAVLNEIIKTT